ncbi:hypothetical protein QE390_004119 [Siphonobacter sp. SORGH_AS 1065]|nr:hypothetical protein [Siphonobacter sp. SORGH_AS_1065]
MTIKFYYNTTTSSSTGWVLATTKTISPRTDASYCRLAAKQLKAVITYTPTAGTYSSFN